MAAINSIVEIIKQTVVKAEHDKAVEEARERYAKGKINREEYKQIMEDLKE